MSEQDRIRWRCRRGLLELDLVLQRFNERYLVDLTPDQQRHFMEILQMNDNDLLDVVMGRADLVSSTTAEFVRLLRTA